MLEGQFCPASMLLVGLCLCSFLPYSCNDYYVFATVERFIVKHAEHAPKDANPYIMTIYHTNTAHLRPRIIHNE